MSDAKLEAVAAGTQETFFELVKTVIPFSGMVIEPIRKYREAIEEQQRKAFVAALADRVAELEQHKDWYSTPVGEEFGKKVVATALNAEYADKVEYLANAFVNGPRLANHDARRLLFVELLRKVSKPAIEVLVVTKDWSWSYADEVFEMHLLRSLQWDRPTLETCLSELHSLGFFQRTANLDGPSPMASMTTLAKEFSQFITSQHGK